jgi:hypothetical protein
MAHHYGRSIGQFGKIRHDTYAPIRAAATQDRVVALEGRHKIGELLDSFFSRA